MHDDNDVNNAPETPRTGKHTPGVLHPSDHDVSDVVPTKSHKGQVPRLLPRVQGRSPAMSCDRLPPPSLPHGEEPPEKVDHDARAEESGRGTD